MNLKMLAITFLCLFSISIVCNIIMVIMVTLSVEWSYEAFTQALHTGYLSTGGTELTGDPIDDPPSWPK